MLPNISRSKENQAIKFFQLLEYKMSNIFLEKSYKHVLGKLVPDPILKNPN